MRVKGFVKRFERLDGRHANVFVGLELIDAASDGLY